MKNSNNYYASNGQFPNSLVFVSQVGLDRSTRTGSDFQGRNSMVSNQITRLVSAAPNPSPSELQLSEMSALGVPRYVIKRCPGEATLLWQVFHRSDSNIS